MSHSPTILKNVDPKPEALQAALRYIAEGRWTVDVERGVINGTRYHRPIGVRARNGYIVLTVRLANGKQAPVLAHRVVWMAAHQLTEFGMLNHRNGRKDDNRLANLEVTTTSQNRLHAVATGLVAVGARHHNAKLTEADVRRIRALRAGGARLRTIAQMFGVSEVNVSYIANGKVWTHVR
jgi:hypothetical protein